MTTFSCVLVANRGEVAVRVLRAAREFGLRTVAVYAEDDASALHVQRADAARPLSGRGPAAYLDQDQLMQVAAAEGCDAIHPGYGFLSERAEFAARCEAEGLTFIGPTEKTLGLLGDKVRARTFALQLGVPVLAGSKGATDLAQAQSFMKSLGDGAAVVVKAVAGGGGRGMRVVRDVGDLSDAFVQCEREARAAFGHGELYLEQLVEQARHVEVQVLGDGHGGVVHIHERECSVQRRHQKVVEIAPSPGLLPTVRRSLQKAAMTLAQAIDYRGLGTFEFLVDGGAGERFWFIEGNPRLQVEHTVTEEVTGLDLVRLQLAVASGQRLAELGLSAQDDVPAPRGFALQLRINAEQVMEDGKVKPQSGQVTAFELPTGPGIRVDTHCYTGYRLSPQFDSLLAKLVVSHAASDFGILLSRARCALAELRIAGVQTNVALLGAVLGSDDLVQGRIHTRYLDEHAAELFEAAARWAERFAYVEPVVASAELSPGVGSTPEPALPPGCVPIRAPMLGSVVSVEVEVGEPLRPEQTVLVLSAMKMEHTVLAGHSGHVHALFIHPGDTVADGQLLLALSPGEVAEGESRETATVALDHVRADLAEVLERHRVGLDERRPEAVAKRRKTGHRTARENLADLVDQGSFVEYGALVIAAQRRRRAVQELIERTPTDGLVCGVGCVNGALFERQRARCVVMSYDYMVLAGTQGINNHRKKDRMFELAERQRLPIVFFTEGGGGRPGDTDGMGASGLDCLAFLYFGRLSGLVPLVGIATGRCFAGNAALFGCCDVTIATDGANIGMGGPAMIEGGGLGVYRPEEVGPVDMQTENGVVDVRVRDEAEAVQVAKQYLSYFQGRVGEYRCADQRRLRQLIPENRLRTYDVRAVIDTLCDLDSVLELRRGFGPGMITALSRVAGRPLGIVANNPAHLAGAIDREGADKAARFMQLCDAFDIPVLFLCDTPGIMVGPESEKTAMVRHASRMFVTAASLTVPFFTIVLRKGYGLGAQLMAGGSFQAPLFIVAWPTGEFGPMGLEGAVRLGFRKELEAIADPEERKRVFETMVAAAYDHGKGVNLATLNEIDDVIDPAESRTWILAALESAPPPPVRAGKKRPCVDTW